MYCPYTKNSELAKNLRQEEERQMGMTGYRMKVVEQAGRKISELLHSSNPWRGQDCGREDCWPCKTKKITGKDKKKECSKRSLV